MLGQAIFIICFKCQFTIIHPTNASLSLFISLFLYQEKMFLSKSSEKCLLAVLGNEIKIWHFHSAFPIQHTVIHIKRLGWKHISMSGSVSIARSSSRSLSLFLPWSGFISELWDLSCSLSDSEASLLGDKRGRRESTGTSLCLLSASL